MSRVNILPPTIFVEEDIQVAHRLMELEGKCQQIHGHSMRVTLRIPTARVNKSGIAILNDQPLDFGDVKLKFRAHLKQTYDHRLLLNEKDPWAQPLRALTGNPALGNQEGERLPGLVTTNGDPTVENIAGWIGMWAAATFESHVIIDIQETASNGVRRAVEWKKGGFGNGPEGV